MEPGANFVLDSPSVSFTLLTAAENSTYREMIESLIYLAVKTHPDILFTNPSSFLEATLMMVMDIFTKSLACVNFPKFHALLNVIELCSYREGVLRYSI